MYTFEVRIDAEIMRQAWNAWFFKGRRMGRLALACFLLLTGIFMDVRHGHFGTMSVVAVTILGFSILIYGTAYFVGLRRAQAKLKGIVEGNASYQLTQDTIEAKSSIGSFALAWSAIKEVRGTRNLVLLGFGGAAFSTIPLSQIPEDALAFLLERTKAAGARITRI
jgi:hypothetical protein